jgi:hypothetical protein
MTMFTCSTCRKAWPENYCPECAHTIDSSAAQQRPVTASSLLVNIESSKRSSNTGVFQYRGSKNIGKTSGESLKQRRRVALVCLCLGLAALALGLYVPIEAAKSARTHPGQPITISTELLCTGLIAVLCSAVVTAGFGQNRVLLELPGGFSLDGLRGPERRQRSF